ncbi:hypothetical protein IscW_ISCW014763 [Ixodes scapularis]|uniref:Uncharacterized protein n=1 Tax=Ixodes scapularis TaxID=6945 RepID=B7QMA2_IXOSC|nr:hypothetical protein IscW_ISCW014763 [Ixodes scapularis]|eukprot:XP_002416307.1 hypothetical protein IscW_ISCW014763 [Ixodes scapularis]
MSGKSGKVKEKPDNKQLALNLYVVSCAPNKWFMNKRQLVLHTDSSNIHRRTSATHAFRQTREMASLVHKRQHHRKSGTASPWETMYSGSAVAIENQDKAVICMQTMSTIDLH